ncbi:hypothetical protein E27107_200329 [Elizabethkingia anophelis]|nr:hypothetical protein E18064_360333 [Elizabethkingia anophelis]CDN77676.1 hypothetical protein E27107_200329 [Elizabethkingia anophelis]
MYLEGGFILTKTPTFEDLFQYSGDNATLETQLVKNNVIAKRNNVFFIFYCFASKSKYSFGMLIL